MSNGAHRDAEKKIVERVEKALKKNWKVLQEPNRVFFASWAVTNPEGRIAHVWEGDGENLKTDEKTLRLIKIWSFIFPEMRENYLIERVWEKMSKNKKSNPIDKFLSIQFCDQATSTTFRYSKKIKKDFIVSLKGNELKNLITQKCKAIGNGDSGRDLKIARILKYDINFNKEQIDGIDEGFSNWITTSDDATKQQLDTLFKELYNDGPPTRHPLDARKFLTMWQNFSVIFPDFSQVVLRFYIPDPRKEPRGVVALFYNETYDREHIKDKTKEIVKDAIEEILVGANHTDDQEDEGYSLWREVRKKKENRELWRRAVNDRKLDRRLDNLMELTGKLAFSIHEGHPCKFTFIAGTEQIWPAIEETISLKFYNNKHFDDKQEDFDAKLFANLCEANYSIFQIDGVVGFYNTKFKSMSKIVRLRYPAKEELRYLEDPISDLDDLFCWAITRIHELTASKSFVVYTSGNGKVSFYGLRDGDDGMSHGDSRLVWDVRTGKLYEPIPNDKLNEIKRAISKLGINGQNNQGKKLINAVRKISAIPGEGACLILSGDERKIDNYVTEMELLKPTWLENLSLDDPQYILKASFVMDGACLITGSKIAPRLAVYPHYEGRTWGLGDLIKDNRFKRKKDKIIRKQSGKGSKTHGSANIASHPNINENPKEPQVVVISISADGPIKIWPQELLKEEREED